MRVLVTGATGAIGQKVCQILIRQGHEVVALSRNVEAAKKRLPEGVAVFSCGNHLTDIESQAWDGVEGVIHLAGTPIAEKPWSSEVKDAIYKSRVDGSRHLLQQAKQAGASLSVMVSGSAIGIYGDRGDEVLSEEASLGEGFLADVCKDWEQAVEDEKPDGLRVSFVRTGMVLDGKSGALLKMKTPFQWGVGGVLASGRQYMSWIHINDIAALFVFTLENEKAEGILNGVAPGAVRNREFTEVFGKVIHRPTLFPVPRLALKMAFGEMSTVLLMSQKVVPERVLSLGFSFEYQDLEKALKAAL